jgi:hypothetical protein
MMKLASGIIRHLLQTAPKLHSHKMLDASSFAKQDNFMFKRLK